MFRKKEKYVRLSTPDEEMDVLIPFGIYEPVAKNMDEEQLGEFFWKFSSYTEKLDIEENVRVNTNLRVRALRGIIDDIHNETNSFLADLNANTNCFGVVDWNNFLSEEVISKIVEKTKKEYLTKNPECANIIM